MPTEGLSEETLKPCPFCRSTLLTVEPTRPGDAWNVYCTDCEASGPILPAHDEVIAAWNNRAEGPAEGLEPRGCPIPGACACPSPQSPDERARIICDFMGWPEDGPAWADAHKLAASLSARAEGPAPPGGGVLEAALAERIVRAIEREELNLPLKASTVTINVLRDCLALTKEADRG